MEILTHIWNPSNLLRCHLALGRRHDIVWGTGYRVTADNHTNGYGKAYVPLSRTNNLFSTFVQDEVALSHSLWLTVGSKFEHNAYTGFAYEPSIKLLLQPTQRHAFWVSASRAIVQTSREEANLIVDLYTFPTAGGGFAVAELQGNPKAKAEQLYDFEAGYRVQMNKRFSLDIATFSGYYYNLSDIVPQHPVFVDNPRPPHLVIPYVFQYVARAHTYGAEAAGVWSVNRHWRISPSLSAIHLTTSHNDGGTGVPEDEDNTPQFQAQVRSSLDLMKNLSWDVAGYHVGRLRDGGDGAVPSYNRIDTRLAWRIGESAEFSLIGQNLLTPQHAEFHNAFEVRRTLVERSIFGKITWRF